MGKYEEALERAKELHESGNALTKLQMEIVFPVLKEIKDEEIRQMIENTLREAVLSERISETSYWEMLAYLEKQKELKPAEWSEEDKKKIRWFINLVNSQNSLSEEWKNECINWIKSIRPQPHWKPSEQEKGAIRTAIHVLTEERNFPKAGEQLQNILNVFEGKESRKDWKPSKEQIDALNSIILNGSFTYVGQVQDLISLKDDHKTTLDT